MGNRCGICFVRTYFTRLFLVLSIYPVIVVMVISCVLAQFFNSLQQRPLNNILPYCVELIQLEIRIRIGTEQREEHIYNWGHKIDREEFIVLYYP